LTSASGEVPAVLHLDSGEKRERADNLAREGKFRKGGGFAKYINGIDPQKGRLVKRHSRGRRSREASFNPFSGY